ncbi:hypothetical protein CYMTET_17542 [Cymbomonas tetramitiformis]|uniref:Uncharacterized protein n=1 Tax=Cymbomonas tetramitiformis TaxID=36881 RepID=A0AAE0L779_9CHLO|nr:hypothetical protein CYMTET_17542 [Cymbomonas tetramitiformis]
MSPAGLGETRPGSQGQDGANNGLSEPLEEEEPTNQVYKSLLKTPRPFQGYKGAIAGGTVVGSELLKQEYEIPTGVWTERYEDTMMTQSFPNEGDMTHTYDFLKDKDWYYDYSDEEEGDGPPPVWRDRWRDDGRGGWRMRGFGVGVRKPNNKMARTSLRRRGKQSLVLPPNSGEVDVPRVTSRSKVCLICPVCMGTRQHYSSCDRLQ